ncbi:Flp pilus assembly protein protease CpaA [Melghirimyces profundicolus]|uniref:Flp pilus assembly protein protease CpaA n=1 Tax=Melghirimyces profundicolus TaxID=1242148 RepID=A0A2T6BGT3_9BACL|nr:prepilin peptidase [Melghirimyces profundicolus]PTX55269.1 Flp pilus assembly protein protease CpaA [Melghirimyces profundicolus]
MTQSLIWMLLTVLLIHATLTDIRERIIRDRIHLIGMMGALFLHFLEPHPPWINYSLTGIGVLAVLSTISVLTGGKAIGGGDIKAFAMIGFAVGWEPFFYVFLFSHLAAAVFLLAVKLARSETIRLGTEFPFAPFILLGVLFSCWLTL